MKIASPLLRLALMLTVLLTGTACTGEIPQTPPGCPVDDNPVAPKDARPLTRLFVQDQDSSALRWVDVRIDEKDRLYLGPVHDLEGNKKLDPKRQKLVQMEASAGLVCVGVRDDDNGTFESGWLLFHSGVVYTDHGDHGHWTYTKQPTLADHRLDAKQGNPAHLYQYDGRFFLANDRLNGYTRIDPKEYIDGGKGTPRFLVGGGNHITLAVVDDRVGYSAWIDGGGPNKGKVDVTPVTPKERSEPKYSFHLPSGGIHGAITCAGKVFFAPVEGICWVEADRNLTGTAETVKVHHIDLGKDGEKARRTGAFTQHAQRVLFVTGKEENTSLVVLDARPAEPKPIFVPLAVKKGSQALTPVIVETPEGKPLAFLFHDHARDVEVDDLLEIVALDPNGDGDYSDAHVSKTLKVGKSDVEGHSGHHDLTFDADRRYGFFTNPGDGTVSVLSLKTLEVVETFKFGGKPTALVAVGGRETDD
jgi:hypothetical protein